jgi:hypothetical protein
MKEQGITTLLFAQAAHRVSTVEWRICTVYVEQEKSMMAGVLRCLPIHGLFTGNLVNYAIVSLLIPVMNRKRFCNPLDINMSEDRIFGREQEISCEASGRNRARFQGRFLKLCNHPVVVQTAGEKMFTTKHGYKPRNSVLSDFVYFAHFVVKISESAMSCKNQSKSNQIKPNPTKSNHYFFR